MLVLIRGKAQDVAANVSGIWQWRNQKKEKELLGNCSPDFERNKLLMWQLHT